MTAAESEFFFRLNKLSQEKYFVFPQVHLSSILSHKVKGQNWRAAFRHINQKSVDFVLCSKDTLQPVYAVELDDYTHEREDRITRDTEVERIFNQAGLPLVRFENKHVSDEEIVSALSSARIN